MQDAAIDTLRSLLKEASDKSVVFFGGAGVSTESGIPDFRSSDGLYSQKFKHPPEYMLSRTFFDRDPAGFFDFYFERMLPLGYEPNRAHRKVAELEKDGALISVVTQNIDGLHQAAGSKTVRELHGSVLRNTCMECGRAADVGEMVALRASSLDAGGDGIPRCPDCDGILKPEVVLYEEPLDIATLEASVKDIAAADILVVAGTSLLVQPAASLLGYFDGSCLAIVNKAATPQDKAADILIQASIGDVFDF